MATVFDYYTYTTDSGTSFSVKIKKADGDAVGNVGGAPNSGLSIRRGKLRKIDGVCTTTNPPTRRRIIMCSTSNPRWTSGTPASFTIGGLTFNVVGRIGEKRY